MTEEIDHVLGCERIDDEARRQRVDQHGQHHRGADDDPQRVEHGGGSGRDHRRGRQRVLAAAQQQGQGEGASERAVGGDRAAPDLEMQQQEADPDEQ